LALSASAFSPNDPPINYELRVDNLLPAYYATAEAAIQLADTLGDALRADGCTDA
jgi:hypothetical protein